MSDDANIDIDGLEITSITVTSVTTFHKEDLVGENDARIEMAKEVGGQPPPKYKKSDIQKVLEGNLNASAGSNGLTRKISIGKDAEQVEESKHFVFSMTHTDAHNPSENSKESSVKTQTVTVTAKKK